MSKREQRAREDERVRQQDQADDDDRMARTVTCGRHHSGNHRLMRDLGSWQCQGCGTRYPHADVVGAARVGMSEIGQ